MLREVIKYKWTMNNNSIGKVKTLIIMAIIRWCVGLFETKSRI